MNIKHIVGSVVLAVAAAASAGARDFEFRESELPVFPPITLEIMINCFASMPAAKGDRSYAGMSHRCGLERGEGGNFTLRFHYHAGKNLAYDLVYKSAPGGRFVYNESWSGGGAIKRYVDDGPDSFQGRTDYYDPNGRKTASNMLTDGGYLDRYGGGDRTRYPWTYLGNSFVSLDRARKAMVELAAMIRREEAKK